MYRWYFCSTTILWTRSASQVAYLWQFVTHGLLTVNGTLSSLSKQTGQQVQFEDSLKMETVGTVEQCVSETFIFSCRANHQLLNRVTTAAGVPVSSLSSGQNLLEVTAVQSGEWSMNSVHRPLVLDVGNDVDKWTLMLFPTQPLSHSPQSPLAEPKNKPGKDGGGGERTDEHHRLSSPSLSFTRLFQ